MRQLLTRFRPFFFYAGLFSFFINLLLDLPGFASRGPVAACSLAVGLGPQSIRFIQATFDSEVPSWQG
jgi:hypothetical protein